METEYMLKIDHVILFIKSKKIYLLIEILLRNMQFKIIFLLNTLTNTIIIEFKLDLIKSLKFQIALKE